MRHGKDFVLDASASTPLYLQLASQIERRVAGGSLAHGDRLPSVRDLARKMAVSPLTIARAYASAQQRGVLAARSGRGVFVVGNSQNMAARFKLLEPALHQLAAEAKQSGLSRTCILAAMQKRLKGG